MSGRVVWLVTKEGVYDHGIWYVSESREGAEQFCAAFSPDSDGYHQWRIDPMPVGVIPAEGIYGKHGKDRSPRAVTGGLTPESALAALQSTPYPPAEGTK